MADNNGSILNIQLNTDHLSNGIEKMITQIGALKAISDSILGAITRGFDFSMKPVENVDKDGLAKSIGDLANKLKDSPIQWGFELKAKVLSRAEDLKMLNAPRIPHLAKGAVLPANKPFLAVVGDQRHGTNVEAPLTSIQEAVGLVMGDYIAAMMAGFEALLKEQRATRQAIAAIEVGDTVIGRAAERYGRKMAVVRGGV